MTNTLRARGYALYLSGYVTYTFCGNEYMVAIVKSQSQRGVYHTVIATERGVVCSCKGFDVRKQCSHIWAVYFYALYNGCSTWAERLAQHLMEEQ